MIKTTGKPVRLAAVLAIIGVLSGCQAIKNKFFADEQKPLEGERISVMQQEQILKPDSAEKEEILLPAPTLNASWPQAGGYANHAMHHIMVSDNLKEIWSTQFGTGSDNDTRIIATPVAAGGSVFTIDAETAVSRLDIKTGDEIWRINLTPADEEDGLVSGGLAYDNGVIYVSTGFAEVIAVNGKDGKILWRKSLTAPLHSAPTVRGGRLFVVSVENKLYALNAKTGETLWTHSGLSETASLLGGASPAVDSGVVVAAYTSGELVALKVDTGRVLWQDTLTAIRRTDIVSTLAQIRGRPIIDRGLVIAVSHSGMMAAIDLRTGGRIWDREIGSMESPWVAGDYIYAITNESEVIAMSRTDGRILWVTPLPRWEDATDKADPIVWSGPILASDRLIITGSNEQAMALSPYDGRKLGAISMPDRVNVAPIVANGTVLFLTENAELIAYR